MVDLVDGTTVCSVLNELIVSAKRAYRCKDGCQNLASTLESIAPMLTDVVHSSNVGNPTCQAWLKDLQTLLAQAQDIVEVCVVKRSKISFKYVERQHLFSKIQGICRRIVGKLSLEGMLVTLDVVQEINRKVDWLSLASHVVDQPRGFELQDVPPVIVSFENNQFQNLRDLILSVPSDVTKTIGVRGKGGVGKTLLAKMVNNDEDIRRKYGDDSILWMTIGQYELVSSIYERMAKFLNDGGVFERYISVRHLEAQRMYLMEAFKQKRALVILDDIWGNCEKNHPMVYWLDICKGDGSTTLITTRDNLVLDFAEARGRIEVESLIEEEAWKWFSFHATERIEVESLSKEESWKLFSFHAFQPNIPPSHAVKNIAMEICDECKGLPLALKVIGGALWDTKDERGWENALSRLKNFESWMNSASLEDELFCRVKFSYDVLNIDAKKCFLYFAAYDEDCAVETEQLNSIWQREKLFGPCDVEDSLSIGRMHLTTLADRSLIDLDEGGKYARVHGVMRDLAICIIRDAKIGEWAHKCHLEPGHALYMCTEISHPMCVNHAPILQVIEPEEYLTLSRICMERAHSLTSSSSLRFNYQQCKYLADKQKLAVESADSFLKLIRGKCLWFPSGEDEAKCLKIFKLLYASVKEVEAFIQSHCSKGLWIQAAMSLTNVSEYVSAIGFDLELWRLVFSQYEKPGVGRSFTLTDFDAIFKAEVGVVEEKSSNDSKFLLRNVNAMKKKGKASAEFQLAALLLERLEGSPKSSTNFDTVHSRMSEPGEAVFSSLKRMNQFATGSSAILYKATWLEGEYALKEFNVANSNDFNKEISVLKRLSHPHIVSLLCSKADYHGKCAIVVELMDGDLRSLTRNRITGAPSQNNDNPVAPLDMMEAVNLMLQVGRGMRYLHEMNIVHRDLKAMNILVRRVKEDSNTVCVVAKVADFGLSKTKESTKTYSNQTLNQGTTKWMAPEMMRATMSESKDKVLNYPFKADIYSFGMVCFEILAGDEPFSTITNSQARKFVLEKNGRPSLPNQCPPSLKSLIEKCWSADPEKRPDFGHICEELRRLKCLLVMPSAFWEVKPALSENIPEQAASTSNSSATGV